MKIKSLWLGLATLVGWTGLVLVSPANADLAVYNFYGVLPTGASSHSQVADGEEFFAQFIVDRTVADSDNRAEFGRFNDAVLSGSLQFSGGFNSALDFSGFDVGVGNDFLFNSTTYDEVSVTGGDIWFIALTEDTSALSSKALPTNETIMPGPITDFLGQFSYNDINGDINYNTSAGQNFNSFSASAVPEPGSLLLLSACGVGFVGIRRRRR